METILNDNGSNDIQKQKASYILKFNDRHSFGSLTTVAYQFVPTGTTTDGGGEVGQRVGIADECVGVADECAGVSCVGHVNEGDGNGAGSGVGVEHGDGVGCRPQKKKNRKRKKKTVLDTGDNNDEITHVYFLNDGFGTAIRVRNFFCQSFFGHAFLH